MDNAAAVGLATEVTSLCWWPCLALDARLGMAPSLLRSALLCSAPPRLAQGRAMHSANPRICSPPPLPPATRPRLLATPLWPAQARIPPPWKQSSDAAAALPLMARAQSPIFALARLCQGEGQRTRERDKAVHELRRGRTAERAGPAAICGARVGDSQWRRCERTRWTSSKDIRGARVGAGAGTTKGKGTERGAAAENQKSH